MTRAISSALAYGMTLLLGPLAVLAGPKALTLEKALSYPFVASLVSAERDDCLAWVRKEEGVRNIWFARGPDFAPAQLTHDNSDDGQELTQLTFSPDCHYLVYVRGGDHTANSTANRHRPTHVGGEIEPTVSLWAASLSGGPARKIADGDSPAISINNQLAYLSNGQVWSVPLDGSAQPGKLFSDIGADEELEWSPDGERLAFVTTRGDHALVGVLTLKDRSQIFLAPSTNWDQSPRWSIDGKRIAFIRSPGEGGDPTPILTEAPIPWSIWVADMTNGTARKVWASPRTLLGSLPDVSEKPLLLWGEGDRLIFVAELDDWPHLYSMPAAGGEPLLLTPGPFMVEHARLSHNRHAVLYDANTGDHAGDSDRRHVFEVPVDRAAPLAITTGTGLEWSPVSVAQDRVAFIASGAQAPPEVFVATMTHAARGHVLTAAGMGTSFPADALVTPQPVQFAAADGLTIHGQLFQPRARKARGPAL